MKHPFEGGGTMRFPLLALAVLLTSAAAGTVTVQYCQLLCSNE
jgi:hypothetical protein